MIKIEMIFPGKGKIDNKEIDITEYEFENFLKHNMVWFGPLWHVIQSTDGTRYFHVTMIMPTNTFDWVMIRGIYEREFGTESVILLETECNCK